jgi:hypothetical protein
MRVVVVEKIARRPEAAGIVGGDAEASLAVKNFIAAIDSDDSLFCAAQPLTRASVEEPKVDCDFSGTVYSGDIVLRFRRAEHSRLKSIHFLLMEKLTELLKADGSQESLEATLCLTQEEISVSSSVSAPENREMRNQGGMALWIRLTAKGDSPERALLRWGLGLAHVQQAVLFSSRHLRLHLTQTNG